MYIKRERILEYFKVQTKVEGHLVGAVCGNGMTARYADLGGADFLLALSAGVFRQMGRSSLTSYMCYRDSNEVTRDLLEYELQFIIEDKPVIFGINATSPWENVDETIEWLKKIGCEGMINFPSVGMIDGVFGEALGEEGTTYDLEVEAIRKAHDADLFTIAFVFNKQQARDMLNAGADVICAHIGFTVGGVMGARVSKNMKYAVNFANEIFAVCDELRPDVIRMVYGGPIKTPIEAQFFYDNTSCQGMIGGSCFDRIPVEKAIYNTTMAFKNVGAFDESNKYYKILTGKAKSYDYTAYVQEYITENYGKPIFLSELALSIHVSESYLSTLFKKKTGMSFTEYLINYRISRACEFLSNKYISIKKISEQVGYTDCAQFCKIFKKKTGCSPSQYRKIHVKNTEN